MKKGENYKCIQDVVMNDEKNVVAYIKDKIYPCEVTDCITDEQGDKNHSWNVNYWNNYFVLVESMVMPDINILLKEIHSLVHDMGGRGIYMEYSSDGTGGVYYATSGESLFYFSNKSEFITKAKQWLLHISNIHEN